MEDAVLASDRSFDVVVRRYVFDTDRAFSDVLEGIFDAISQPDIGALFDRSRLRPATPRSNGSRVAQRAASA